MNTGSDSAFDEFIDSPSMFESFENKPRTNPASNGHSFKGLSPRRAVDPQTQIIMEVSGDYIPPHDIDVPNTGLDASFTQHAFRNALGFVTSEDHSHQQYYTSINSTNGTATASSSSTSRSSTPRIITPAGSPSSMYTMQSSMIHSSNGIPLGFQPHPMYQYKHSSGDTSQPIPIASPQLSTSKKPIYASPVVSISHSLPSGGDGSLSYSDFYSSSLHHARSPDTQNSSVNPYSIHTQRSQSSSKSESVNNFNSLNHLSLAGLHTPNSSTPSPNLSPSDASQLAKREKNRLAAERCRRKKQELIGSLSSENQQLQQEIFELRKVNQVLEQKLDYLISVMAKYGIPMPYSKP